MRTLPRDPLHAPLPTPPAILRQGPTRAGTFNSGLHNRYVAAWLGYALGWTFSICFVTGLISHFAQHPTSLFDLPARPIWLYRFTQGLHVATGLVTVPLLLAKLWTVYPRFWEWPPVRTIAHAIERISLLGLVGGAVFELLTGIANIYEWYFFKFFFTPTHYFTAWIVMGSLVIHVGTKITLARDALRHPERYDTPAAAVSAAGAAAGAAVSGAVARVRPAQRPAAAPVPHPDGPHTVAPTAPLPQWFPTTDGLSRRGFLGAVVATAGAVTLVTVGETVSPLGSLDLLGARKPGTGAQHLPINRTARGAGVTKTAADPGYVLQVMGPKPFTLTLAQLDHLATHTVRLPITCVEGWSADGVWTGIRLRDLLDMAGAPHGAHVQMRSLEKSGLYNTSVVNPSHARDPLTLLATRLHGERLVLDHGYPLRLIAPDRPGVLQTKWVHQIEVLT